MVDVVEYRRQNKETRILLYEIKIRKVLYVRDSYLDDKFKGKAERINELASSIRKPKTALWRIQRKVRIKK